VRVIIVFADRLIEDIGLESRIFHIQAVLGRGGARLPGAWGGRCCCRPLVTLLRGGLAVGRWTCDLQVVGSIPGWSAFT